MRIVQNPWNLLTVSLPILLRSENRIYDFCMYISCNAYDVIK